jgi:hypothetical protein
MREKTTNIQDYKLMYGVKGIGDFCHVLHRIGAAEGFDV